MIDQSWYSKPNKTHISLSAGGVVTRLAGKKVLVALVREGKFQDYILPKGRVEPGESIEEAARREISEEAGLDSLILLCKLGVQERWNFRKTAWKIIHYLLFTTYQIEGKPVDTGHNYTCEWFSINTLPPMFWPEQQKLFDANRDKIIAQILKYNRTNTQQE
ncbi:MAG: NUDIX domain-containing protein [Anaerolineales bacterium]|nr:NUDIX domain-containing protein [Anaerolineales bacterium]